MKVQHFFRVLMLVFLALSWSTSEARRHRIRVRHRHRHRIPKFMKSKPAPMWPTCMAVERGPLVPLVKSAIMGQMSKKLLAKCGYEEELSELEVWRETMHNKLDNDMVVDVIAWLYEEVQILLNAPEVPQAGQAGHGQNSAHPAEIHPDSEGPTAPESCHDFRLYVQVVDDEVDLNDADWSYKKFE
ncbi:uncharacterized protein LOC117586361 [Drosophila guanche]|uniref:Uncharacterized protein n=1 Tax=Drosophila guanche TaxID=7266 RepID=A0A3B0KHL2_DROGU|nr:uncharacterized protein LOC117586361 [Drosophila guanche]SPP84591.1 Hypothetical predicted protein [Drosophila guanche]